MEYKNVLFQMAGSSFEQLVADMGWLLYTILGITVSAGILYSIFLAYQLAKASNENERSAAKKRIMMTVSSVLIVLILTTMLLIYGEPGPGPTGTLRFGGLPTGSDGAIEIPQGESVPVSMFTTNGFDYGSHDVYVENSNIASIEDSDDPYIEDHKKIVAKQTGDTKLIVTTTSTGWFPAELERGDTLAASFPSSVSVPPERGINSREYKLRVIARNTWATSYPYQILFDANGGTFMNGGESFYRKGLRETDVITANDLLGMVSNELTATPDDYTNNTFMVSRANHTRIAWTARRMLPNAAGNYTVPTAAARIFAGTTVKEILDNPNIERTSVDGVTTIKLYAFWTSLYSSSPTSPTQPAPEEKTIPQLPTVPKAPSYTPAPAGSKSVMLDAGHGGKKTGALSTSGNRRECDDNLRMTLAVGQILAGKSIKVFYTRTTDKHVENGNRVAMSNAERPNLFVSFHRDAFSSTEPNGISTWIHRTPSPATRNAANNVYNNIKSVWQKKGTTQNWNRNINEKSFTVLCANAPAILLELGFITNSADNVFFDAQFNALANAIANGIMASL